ncbi:MAG TPA: pyruvate, phosphate dikinase [Alphaproteobacteria bacterium]|nr:pyruvate, phosphate dikinase [Alphaproteobacteria bacterium]
MTRWVYSFGKGKAEGNAAMRELLGGKGANLAEMTNLGLPVPSGFTITTEVCTYFYANGNSYPSDLVKQTESALEKVEKSIGAKFGDEKNPLLVSVRTGGRASMPGMMDTILNLGLNDKTAAGLAQRSGDARFAYDSYRRFMQMYGSVVLDISHHKFEDILDSAKREFGRFQDGELTAEDWQTVCQRYQEMVQRETGKPFPQDVNEQLWGAIGAVFESWMNPRAKTYRKLNDIPADWGTAVNVQAMVFGNQGNDCATGVAFTRDPSTGENTFYGEFLVNAQGEDVVAGIRTPQQITIAGKKAQKSDAPAMEEVMPDVFKELDRVRHVLEKHYRDMQDIEFTVQQGKLYLLQTRNGKRTAQAAIRIAVEMAEEKLITRDEAITRINPSALDQLLHPRLDPNAPRQLLTRGLPASPGAAVGKIYFSADDAETHANLGEPVVLCRIETSPEDIHGMYAAKGIITARGGMTSHAAVVARGMGRPCVVGAGELQLDYTRGALVVGGQTLVAGDWVTLDGSTGEVMAGQVATLEPNLSGDFSKLMAWADAARRMQVRANAETQVDAETARRLGAEGIGLCRTEHMFFDPARIMAVREMIVAKDEAGRRGALAKLLPMQQADFHAIFKVMDGLPVTIRLLDPPLHEFLPHGEKEIAEVAAALKIEKPLLQRRLEQLHESNPMLGHRGCRLGVTYPEIYEMQAEAIYQAAAAAQLEGVDVKLEIMIPLVATQRELTFLKERIVACAEKIVPHLKHLIGVMIELPRAALAAGDIARDAEFFSFGTNDLTQTTLGLSRDDAGHFLPDYQRLGIYPQDPFVSIDQDGVGQLVQIAAERGRTTRNNIKLGVCGEHGGDPASIQFFETVGLDYVSCSPYRVPIARLAAAQATIASSGKGKAFNKAAAA